MAARTITLMAPSKTYNIPGLGCAFAIIPTAAAAELPPRHARHRAARQCAGHGGDEAALSRCDDWQAALLDYLRGNARAVERAVADLPGLDMRPVEATCLAWIDAREFAADRASPTRRIYFEQHGLGLSDGADFGTPGFVRLNFGTRRALLDEALARLARAVKTAGVGSTPGFGDDCVEAHIVCLRPDVGHPAELEADADRLRARNHRRQRAVEIATAVAEAKALRVEGHQRQQHDVGP
jgi:hypothetical protein